MPELQGDPACFFMLADTALKWLLCTGPYAPCQVEPWNRVAMPRPVSATALCPTNNGKPAHPLIIEPLTHFSGRKVDICLSPFAGPFIFGPVKLSAAHPVLYR